MFTVVIRFQEPQINNIGTHTDALDLLFIKRLREKLTHPTYTFTEAVWRRKLFKAVFCCQPESFKTHKHMLISTHNLPHSSLQVKSPSFSLS